MQQGGAVEKKKKKSKFPGFGRLNSSTAQEQIKSTTTH